MTETESALQQGANRFMHQISPFRPQGIDTSLTDMILESPDGGVELVNEYCFMEALATAVKIESNERRLTNEGYGGQYLHGSIPFAD